VLGSEDLSDIVNELDEDIEGEVEGELSAIVAQTEPKKVFKV